MRLPMRRGIGFHLSGSMSSFITKKALMQRGTKAPATCCMTDILLLCGQMLRDNYFLCIFAVLFFVFCNVSNTTQ